jgi:2-oxoglutarate dehydrogenase E1 component
MSGMVMLLPHGYEGSGPEHSYGYLGRFLSLCAEDNIQVIYPSTPAQYFHVLRRQMKREFRKPLILFMPKQNLRDAISSLTELTEGSFGLVLDDPNKPAVERVRRVLMCSGKIYFALETARKNAGITDLAIVRVEQLYPYPQKELEGILAKYKNAREVVWVQEEPQNRGAWVFISDRLQPMLAPGVKLTYCGREEAASPAVGSKKSSDAEEAEIIALALDFANMGKDEPGAMAAGNGQAKPAAAATAKPATQVVPAPALTNQATESH